MAKRWVGFFGSFFVLTLFLHSLGSPVCLQLAGRKFKFKFSGMLLFFAGKLRQSLIPHVCAWKGNEGVCCVDWVLFTAAASTERKLRMELSFVNVGDGFFSFRIWKAKKTRLLIYGSSLCNSVWHVYKSSKNPHLPIPAPNINFASSSLLSARNTFALHMVPLNFQLAKCGQDRDPKLNAFSGFALHFRETNIAWYDLQRIKVINLPDKKIQVAPNPPLSN